MNQQSFAGKWPGQNGFVNFILLRWLKKSTIVEFIALLHVVLFLYAGISKLLDYKLFMIQMALSDLLYPFARTLVWVIPLTEFVISIMLFLPATRRKGLYGALTLMSLFTLFIIVITTFYEETPCSCGGVLGQLPWSAHIAFNCAFIAMALAGIRMHKQTSQLNRVH